jgi:hypothetical protein
VDAVDATVDVAVAVPTVDVAVPDVTLASEDAREVVELFEEDLVVATVVVGTAGRGQGRLSTFPLPSLRMAVGSVQVR